MLGMEKMVMDMLGIDPEELKAQIATVKAQGEHVVSTIVQNQNVTIEGLRLMMHRQIRIEKMLECLLRDKGLEIPTIEDNANVGRIGNGSEH